MSYKNAGFVYTPGHEAVEPQSYLQFCRRFQSLNLTAVAQQLRKQLQWNNPQILRGLECYRQALFLISQYPDQPIVPDRVTDAVIHAHLKTGYQFVQDCQQILDCRLAHEAGFGRQDEGDRHTWLTLFKLTQTRLRMCCASENLKAKNSAAERWLSCVELERDRPNQSSPTFHSSATLVWNSPVPAYCILRQA